MAALYVVLVAYHQLSGGFTLWFSHSSSLLLSRVSSDALLQSHGYCHYTHHHIIRTVIR